MKYRPRSRAGGCSYFSLYRHYCRRLCPDTVQCSGTGHSLREGEGTTKWGGGGGGASQVLPLLSDTYSLGMLNEWGGGGQRMSSFTLWNGPLKGLRVMILIRIT